MKKLPARPRLRTLIAGAVAAAATLAFAGPAEAANPWLQPPTQFLDMAHQGGELEAPGNTLYAFKTAMRDGGADSIEMDSYVTKDGYLVISHNATLNGTTDFGTPHAPAPFNEPGASPYIWDYDLADLKKLDDAYWFVPGVGQYNHSATNRRFRGVATGEAPPPPGYTANDFTIPTFQEVLDAFPDTRINIDLKDQNGFTNKGIEAAHALAAILKAQPGGDNENVLVASFGQEEMEAFHQDMPEHRSLSASLDATSDYALQGKPISPTPAALQPPDVYDISGTTIQAPEFLKGIIDKNGDPYALHVWGADATVENDALYQRMLDVPVQGFFTQEPSKLSAWLCMKNVPRPDGSSHCSPNPGMPGIGSWEDPTGPVLRMDSLHLPKGKARAGRPSFIRLSLGNAGDQAMTGVEACVTAPKKTKKAISLGHCVKLGTIAPGEEGKGRLRLRPKRRAHGKYTLTIAIKGDDGVATSRKAKLKVAPAH
jgi:glycerophosphoryl diester phosphodiesterase